MQKSAFFVLGCLLGMRAQGAPAVAANGVVNASGDRSIAPAAPGSLVSIYGSGLASSAVSATPDANGRLPLLLGGTEVRIADRRAPLLFVSGSQINAQIPFEVVPGKQPLVVTAGGQSSTPIEVEITPTAPGIFAGAVTRHRDNSVISSANPAIPGEILIAYCTGLGATQPSVPTGQAAPPAPIGIPGAAIRATLGGRAADVVGAAASPGFVGLYQVAFHVPAGVASGTASLVLTAGAISSNTAAVAVISRARTFVSWRRYITGSTLVAAADVNGDRNIDIVGLGNNGITVLLGSGDGELRALAPVPFGRAPTVLLPADFDGDGTLDVIAGHTSGVLLFRGTGGGIFSRHLEIALPQPVASLATADFDRDGRLDLVAALGTDRGEILVLLNRGGSYVQEEYGIGRVRSVAVADLNGDNFPDVLVSRNTLPGTAILFGTGDGKFRSPVPVETSTATVGTFIVDLNRDGTPDIVQANSRDVGISLGTGGGSFAAERRFQLPPGDGSVINGTCGFSDLNGDGIPDLILYRLGANGALVALAGDGRGSFGAPLDLNYGGLRMPTFVGAADLNNDGWADLITATGRGHLTILVSRSSPASAELRLLPVAPDTYNAAIGDINGDGLMDIAVASSPRLSITRSTLWHALMTGSREFGPFIDFTLDGRFPLMRLADLNGDGRADLVASAGTGILVWEGGAAGLNNRERQIFSAVELRDFALPDLNGDRAPDLLVSAGNQLFTFLNDRAGHYAQSEARPISVAAGLQAADFDGDGSVDVLVTSNQRYYLLQGNGNGTFQAPREMFFGASGAGWFVSDINGDRKVDLAICSNKVVFYTQLAELRRSDFEVDAGVACSRGMTTDLDGDGTLDLILSGEHDGEPVIAIVFGNPDGTFQPSRLYGVRWSIRDLAAYDFDGDGATDIVAAGAGGVWVLLSR